MLCQPHLPIFTFSIQFFLAKAPTYQCLFLCDFACLNTDCHLYQIVYKDWRMSSIQDSDALCLLSFRKQQLLHKILLTLDEKGFFNTYKILISLHSHSALTLMHDIFQSYNFFSLIFLYLQSAKNRFNLTCSFNFKLEHHI